MVVHTFPSTQKKVDLCAFKASLVYRSSSIYNSQDCTEKLHGEKGCGGRGEGQVGESHKASKP